jgi:hypothetical protein
MTKADAYRRDLRTLADWEPYLLAHSGLPGPRGNLELAHVAAEEVGEAQLARWRALTSEKAPVNSPEEFLVFCGVLGLGRELVTAKETSAPRELRAFAADPRWRTREAVAMALQQWGDADIDALLTEMRAWARADDPQATLRGCPVRTAPVARVRPCCERAPHPRRNHRPLESNPARSPRSRMRSRLRQALGYC